ncbi:hypothetical protein MKW94_010975 [Papaver nudicaule]|uniref:glucose-1-phosphate adenylyltransferase n=1 Tax=Papaver nudicaule TaxID=74823 RepID=A0AA41SAE6_PAPNU|nr:hypothetical protein [Papaver nudicaule]
MVMAASSSIGEVMPTQPSSSVIANKTATSILIKPNHQSLSSSYSSSSSNLLSLKTVFNNTKISTSGGGGRRRRIPFVVSPTCSVDPDASRSALGIILGDGGRMQFDPIVKRRKRPPIPLQPNYKLIDMFISNCLDSNIPNIYVLTQEYSYWLDRRLSGTYVVHKGGYENEVFFQRSPVKPAKLYTGTADAVRQYLWLLEQQNVTEYLILAGDYTHRMDYGKFIQAHRETEADITVAALPIDENRAASFGLMKIDGKGQIIKFSEKPRRLLKIDEKGPFIEHFDKLEGEQLKAMKVDTTILGLDDERAVEMPYISSMGMYVVSKDVLLNLLRDKFPRANEFESEVIPGATSMGLKVQAYLYDGNWEDINSTRKAFITQHAMQILPTCIQRTSLFQPANNMVITITREIREADDYENGKMGEMIMSSYRNAQSIAENKHEHIGVGSCFTN